MEIEMRRPGLQVPFSCRSHRRVMTSVVVERLIFLHVFAMCFDRLGRCSLSLLRDCQVTGVYSWTVLLAFYVGWLAAPLTHLFFLGGFVARETPILAGGIGVARAVVGAFLLFVFGDGTIMSQCC